jgi:hypothetical protein
MSIWGGDEKTTTTTDAWSQYDVDPMGMEEAQGLRMGYDVMRGLEDELAGMGPEASLKALSRNLINELFGSMGGFRKVMEGRDATPEQRAAIEKAYTTAFDVARGRHETAGRAAQRRVGLSAQNLMRSYKDQLAASGMRGTTAGAERLAERFGGLAEGVTSFEQGMQQERGALARTAGGGMAGALLEYPLRDKAMMLQFLGAAGAEKQRLAGIQNKAMQARSMILGNPMLDRLYGERMATGRKTSRSTTVSEKEGGFGLGSIMGGAWNWIPKAWNWVSENLDTGGGEGDGGYGETDYDYGTDWM